MKKQKSRFITPKFTILMVVFGIVFFIIGLGSLFIAETKSGGILFMLIGIFLSLSHTGIDIDLKNNKFRCFSSHFGIKKGKWKEFENYPFLTLLTINQKQTVRGQGNAGVSTRFVVYRIHLLNKKHTEKILIKEYRNKTKAEKILNELANELGLKVEVYSPDFS